MSVLQGDPAIRPTAVAGTFYPADEVELQAQLDRLLDENGSPPQPWPAALVPHAGWVYSGRVAAAVLERIEIPPTVVVFCPQHHAGGAPWAVAPYDGWSIPGTTISSDTALAQKLVDCIDGLEFDVTSHRKEHAIEVQLPLLHRLAPQSRVVGITCGRGDWESCSQMADELAGVLRERIVPVLLLISSDMNHFAPDAVNRRLDSQAIEAMQILDARKLYDTCRQLDITMCGLLPTVLVMETLRRLDRLHRCEKVAYATSADAGGDVNRVVGYAGMLFG